MTEWSNVTVLKTVVSPSGTVGSNPTLSVPLTYSVEFLLSMCPYFYTVYPPIYLIIVYYDVNIVT